MLLFTRLRSVFRTLFRTRELEQELDEELQSYLDLRMAQKIREGLPVNQARRETMLELGGVEQVKENVREERRGAFLDVLAQDLRGSIRTLRRDP